MVEGFGLTFGSGLKLKGLMISVTAGGQLLSYRDLEPTQGLSVAIRGCYGPIRDCPWVGSRFLYDAWRADWKRLTKT